MRTSVRLLAVLAVIFSLFVACTVAVSWSTEDIEIFNVRYKIIKLQGKDVDFYKYVGIAKEDATTNDAIARAYRRRSLLWHPDKAKGDRKKAQDRFTLLGLAADVLRDPRRRERYDFFLKNGFPEWTGSDYLYSRFRPGLVSTLVFLLLFISGGQYVFHSLTASRHRAHIKRYIKDAKEMAWRPHGGNPPLSGARKYVALTSEGEEGMGPVRKFVVDFDGSVFFIDEQTGEESLLDVNEIDGASWKRTLVYTLPLMLWNTIAARFLSKKGKGAQTEKVQEDDVVTASGNGNGNTLGSGKHVKAEKIAGGRRKVQKRN